MFRLTREVRFAINSRPDEQLSRRPSNSYAGFPSLTGLGYFFALQATLAGEVKGRSYLVNTKEIDQRVREIAVPLVQKAVTARRIDGRLMIDLFANLKDAWPATLGKLKLQLTPLLSLAVHSTELPMIRLSQKFEFSASHRLYDPSLSDEENLARFGKCSNPHGHGHNYELEVTMQAGTSDADLLAGLPALERTVSSLVIDRFDHKNLNVEIPEFRQVIPSVENIAMVIYRLLKPALNADAARLTSVTVWETRKTWCEFSE
jgi:6-pyruvoyltetrahydropterin/6-carboxytetrahydropterin synthase